MATSTLKRPIKFPYPSEVHEACWKAWDEYREEKGIEDSYAARSLFMDGWVLGVNA